MTVGYLWGLVATIGFFAFTLILEIVKLSRSLKSSDEELTSARQKITALEDKNTETVSDLKKVHQNETEELRNNIVHKIDLTTSLSEKSICVLQYIANLENHFKKHNPAGHCVIDETDFSSTLELSHQGIKYHLEQLISANCIEHYPSGKYGGLRSKGRELLQEKGLLP